MTGKAFLLLIICSVFNIVKAQNLKFQTIDANTEKPVPFTYVIDSAGKLINSSDINGYFILNQKDYGQKFSLMQLGYEATSFNVKTNENVQQIKLKEKSVELSAINIKSKKYKKVALNDFKIKDWRFFSSRFGGEIATYINNSENYSNAQILSVSANIRSLSDSNYLRINVYDKDLSCNCPGEKILDSSYVVRGLISESRHKFNIWESLVSIPDNGVFISLEIVNMDNSSDEVVLGQYSQRIKFSGRTYHRTFNKKWGTPNKSDRGYALEGWSPADCGIAGSENTEMNQAITMAPSMSF